MRVADAAPRRALAAATLVALGALGAFLAGHDPATPGTYPPCPVRAATGLLCPGCGTLRALHALLHGDVAAAWAANPLTVLATPLMLWAVVTLARYAATGRWASLRVPTPLPPRLRAPALLVALLAWMVARNVVG